MTSKNSTSLTRQALLDKLTVEVTRVEIEGFGVVYVKPRTELQRTQRQAKMWKNEKIVESEFGKRRLYDIIDHVCDENGENLFSEKDVKTLSECDSYKIDPLYMAIDKVFGEQEGNDQAE